MDTGQARHRMHRQGTGCTCKEHEQQAGNRMPRQEIGVNGPETGVNWPETGVNRQETGVLWPDTECTGQKQE